MYLDSKRKLEKLGIKPIDPDSYKFRMSDHVCVYFTKTPPVIFNEHIDIPSLPFGFWHHGICIGENDKNSLLRRAPKGLSCYLQIISFEPVLL